jgi:mercuric reductase
MRFSKYQKVLWKLNNVKYVNGFASFKDKDTLSVGENEIKAKRILIATGAKTKMPKIKWLDKVEYLTNEEALFVKALPKSMIIMGGGALGLEFAGMFAHLGVDVSLLQRGADNEITVKLF